MLPHSSRTPPLSNSRPLTRSSSHPKLAPPSTSEELNPTTLVSGLQPSDDESPFPSPSPVPLTTPPRGGKSSVAVASVWSSPARQEAQKLKEEKAGYVPQTVEQINTVLQKMTAGQQQSASSSSQSATVLPPPSIGDPSACPSLSASSSATSSRKASFSTNATATAHTVAGATGSAQPEELSRLAVARDGVLPTPAQLLQALKAALGDAVIESLSEPNSAADQLIAQQDEKAAENVAENVDEILKKCPPLLARKGSQNQYPGIEIALSPNFPTFVKSVFLLQRDLLSTESAKEQQPSFSQHAGLLQTTLLALFSAFLHCENAVEGEKVRAWANSLVIVAPDLKKNQFFRRKSYFFTNYKKGGNQLAAFQISIFGKNVLALSPRLIAEFESCTTASKTAKFNENYTAKSKDIGLLFQTKVDKQTGIKNLVCTTVSTTAGGTSHLAGADAAFENLICARALSFETIEFLLSQPNKNDLANSVEKINAVFAKGHKFHISEKEIDASSDEFNNSVQYMNFYVVPTPHPKRENGMTENYVFSLKNPQQIHNPQTLQFVYHNSPLLWGSQAPHSKNSSGTLLKIRVTDVKYKNKDGEVVQYPLYLEKTPYRDEGLPVVVLHQKELFKKFKKA